MAETSKIIIMAITRKILKDKYHFKPTKDSEKVVRKYSKNVVEKVVKTMTLII